MTTTKTRKMDRFIQSAAERLVSGFDKVDADLLQAKVQEETGNPFPLPMWSTLFKVGDSCDARNIRDRMQSGMPETEDAALNRLHDNGIGIDLSRFYTCTKCGEGIESLSVSNDGEPGDDLTAGDLLSDADSTRRADIVSPCCNEDITCDEPGLVEATREAWIESGDDNAELALGEWQDVNGTSLIAFDFDGDLYLGCNSAGHNFYDAYWIPLYKALGYEWHIQMFREAMLDEAVRDLASIVEQGPKGKKASKRALADLDKRIIRAAHKVAARRKAQGNGGPLSKSETREAESEA